MDTEIINNHQVILDETLACWYEGIPYAVPAPYIKHNIYRKIPIELRTKKSAKCLHDLNVKMKSMNHFIRYNPIEDFGDSYTKLEGRFFYLLEGEELEDYVPKNKEELTEVRIKPVLPRLLGKGVIALKPTNYCSLANLVCSIFNAENVEQLARGEYCDGALCTLIGSRIARSLVKIASVRIFAEPEQSILELPVNSLDAYGNAGSVGKFGMGFFSILYWLVGHSRRTLNIFSYYQEKGTHKAFRAAIQEIDGELVFTVSDGYESNVTQSGVRIHLENNGDRFNYGEITKFTQQLQKLKYTDSSVVAMVDISTTPNSKGRIINRASVENKNRIMIEVNDENIIIEDFATGISLETLLTKLFVPAISSKGIGIADAVDSDYVNDSNIYLTNEHPLDDIYTVTFSILVRKIAVVQIYYKTTMSFPYDTVIDLPGVVRVPVSRDDFILDENSKNYIYQSLLLVAKECYKIGNLYLLEEAISEYIKYTTNTENAQFMKEVLRRAISKTYEERYILVPWQHYRLYTKLFDNVVATNFPDITRLESLVLSRIHPDRKLTDVFTTKTVILLDDLEEDVDNGGTMSLLFINRRYIEKHSNWINNIILSYSMIETLHPVSSLDTATVVQETALFKNDQEKVDTEIAMGFVSENAAKAFYQTLSVFTTLYRKFNPSSSNPITDYRSTLLNTFRLLYFGLGETFTIEWLNKFSQSINNLEPTITYGEDGARFGIALPRTQFSTEILLDEFLSGLLYKLPENRELYNPSPKAIQFAKEWMIYMTKFKPTNVGFWFPTRFTLAPLYTLLWPYFINITEKTTNMFLTFKGKSKKLKKLFYLDHYKYLKMFDNVFEYMIFIQLEQQMVANKLISWINKNSELYIQFIINTVRTKFGNARNIYPNNCEIFNMYNVARADTGWYVDDSERYIALNFTDGGKFKNSYFLNPTYIVRIYQSVRLMIDQHQEKLELPMVSFTKPKNTKLRQYKFTESDLIHYTMRKNFKTLDNVFSSCAGYHSRAKERIQITEIAINEGSTKDFINASLTELIQNSMDAIRLFNPENKSIDFIVGINKKNSSELVLKIKDYVGIQDDGLLAMMIPFLSNKTASEIVTGEMGSGFFNIYRKTSAVRIETSKNRKLTIINDVPMYDSIGRVVDIERNVLRLPRDTDDGYTAISMFIPFKNDNEKITLISSIRYLITGVFSTLPVRMRLNSKNILSVIPSGVIENDLFSCGMIINPEYNIPSYVHTKGVPFSSLSDFLSGQEILANELIDEINENVIINVKNGAYTPVQTRARLNMSVEMSNNLREFVEASLFYTMLNKLRSGNYRGELEDFLPGMNANVEVDQVLPPLVDGRYNNYTAKELYQFMPYYSMGVLADQPHMNCNFSVLLHHGAKYFDVDKPFSAVRDKVMVKVAEKLNQYDIVFSDKIPVILWTVEKWFSDKLGKSSKGFESEHYVELSGSISAESEELVGFKHVERILEVLVRKYWAILKENNLLSSGASEQAPSVEISRKMVKHMRGFYQFKGNVIKINYRILAGKWGEFEDALASKNIAELYKTEIYQELLSIKAPASTLIHELEHARRHSAHEAGVHDPIIITFPGQAPKSYKFDYGALAVWTFAVQQGLFTNFLRAL